MAKNGLLIDYEYCSGCYTCVVACKQEHDYPVGKGGIIINEIITENGDEVRTDYLPFPTEFCDLCAARTIQGQIPACVKHCMANCMMYGPLDKLTIKMEDMERSVIFAPRASAGIARDVSSHPSE
jgi:Fe-S-cluster-containing dehydrogenase component